MKEAVTQGRIYPVWQLFMIHVVFNHLSRRRSH